MVAVAGCNDTTTAGIVVDGLVLRIHYVATKIPLAPSVYDIQQTAPSLTGLEWCLH